MAFAPFKELGDTAIAKINEYDLTGKLILYSLEEVRSEQRILKREGHELRSNDPHMLALARISGARLLFTADNKLMDDFREKRILGGRKRGKIYSSKGNTDLLTNRACAKK